MAIEPEAPRNALQLVELRRLGTLKTSYHQGLGYRRTANDIHDIYAVGSTIPHWAVASHAQRTGLAERLETAVVARLSDLVPLMS